MLERENVERVMNDFAKTVISQARRNLTLKSGNKTKALYDSFEREVKSFANSVQVDIISSEYNEYGRFQNYGIRGVESGRSLKGWRFKNHSTPFKKGARVIPPISAFKTDKINRIVSDGQARASAINVWKFGIRPTEFFSRPFEAAFKKLPNEIVEAYGLDLEKFMEFTLND